MAPPQQLRQLQTSNCSLLLIYRPRKDERLSWPGWLTCSGWFTHLSGHPSTAGPVQDSESTPAKDRRSTAGLCNATFVLKRDVKLRPTNEPRCEFVTKNQTIASQFLVIDWVFICLVYFKLKNPTALYIILYGEHGMYIWFYEQSCLVNWCL